MRYLRFVFTVLWASAAVATPWALLFSFPTPTSNPRGYDDFLYGVVADGPTPYVYRFTGTQGSIYSSFPAPGGSGAWGLGSYQSYLYIGNYSTSWIYKTTLGGSLISSFKCPLGGPADFDIGSYPGFPPYYVLHIAFPDLGIIGVVNQNTGSLIATFAAPGPRPLSYEDGLGTHNTCGDGVTHKVYEDMVPVLDVDAAVGLDKVYTTNGIPSDLTIVDDSTDRVYWYTNNTVVTPASLGRVKALFR